jgi:hypothetical protein
MTTQNKPPDERLARIDGLTHPQAVTALRILAAYAPGDTDFALAHAAPPAEPEPALAVVVQMKPPSWFCADCGADGALVPLVERDGIYLCNEARQCLARLAAKAAAR